MVLNRCIFEATFAEVCTIGAESTRRLEQARETIEFIGAESSIWYDLWHHAWSQYARTVCWRDCQRRCCHLSAVEHHAHLFVAENAKRYGFSIEIVPIDQRGNIDRGWINCWGGVCASHGVSDDLQCNWKPLACGNIVISGCRCTGDRRCGRRWLTFRSMW